MATKTKQAKQARPAKQSDAQRAAELLARLAPMVIAHHKACYR